MRKLASVPAAAGGPSRGWKVLLVAGWLCAAPCSVRAELINPGFESGLTGWTVQGSSTTTPPALPFPNPPPPPPATSSGSPANASTLGFLAGIPPGPLTNVLPTEAAAFALLSNAAAPPGGNPTATRISQTFDLPVGPPGLPTSLLFEFRFMTNDINTSFQFNDAFQATLTVEGGPTIRLAQMDRNALQPDGSGELTSLATAGVGGFTAGTQWLTAETDITAFLGQRATLSFVVWDVGDNAGNSAVALDNIRTEAVPEPSTLILFGMGVIGLAATRRRWRK